MGVYLRPDTDPALRDIAREIVFGQSIEIGRMVQMLREFGAPESNETDTAMAWMNEPRPPTACPAWRPTRSRQAPRHSSGRRRQLFVSPDDRSPRGWHPHGAYAAEHANVARSALRRRHGRRPGRGEITEMRALIRPGGSAPDRTSAPGQASGFSTCGVPKLPTICVHCLRRPWRSSCSLLRRDPHGCQAPDRGSRTTGPANHAGHGANNPTADAPATPTTDRPPDPSTSTPLPVPDRVIDLRGQAAQRYDGFLDRRVQRHRGFWDEQFPLTYGGDFKPLAGGIFAAYPDRTDADPRLRHARRPTTATSRATPSTASTATSWPTTTTTAPQLVKRPRRGAVGVVLAHEFGHAVQARADEFGQPTILKEQQADCFAGAWAAHVARGESDASSSATRTSSRPDRHDPGARSGRSFPASTTPTRTAPASTASARSRTASTAARSAARPSSTRTAKLIDIPFDPQ